MFSATSKPAFIGGFFVYCLLAICTLISGVWLIFGSAQPGIIHFDDIGNLAGLAAISDVSSAWQWTQEGNAGPIGRPLALLTFALQSHEWPHPAAFLQWNIVLHTLNALLVLWLAVLVTHRLGHSEITQVKIGFLVALTWALLPLLNTAVLFIVQRMTLLSATFTLTGLIAYLKILGPVSSTWPRQVAALGALAISGTLALLAKETGALIVVYALVLEWLLIVQANRKKPTLAAMLLLIGNALLIVALLPHSQWPNCTELTRGFTVWERLGSQGMMLVVYLKGLFFPSASDLNPFRFEFLLRDTKNMEWGVALWTVLMLSPLFAWHFGGRLRALALALAWFFYGHIMESGWISLEPYFAHRNYFPALGLVFLLVTWVFVPRQTSVRWHSIGIAYIVILAGVSWMNTSLWGNRALAAEIWAMEEPRSTRAALNLAYHLEQEQGLGAAQDFLDRSMTERRNGVGLRLQSLISACKLNSTAHHAELVQNAIHAINHEPYEGWATDLVEKLLDITLNHQCNDVTLTETVQITTAFLNQPAYQCSPPIKHNLLTVLGIAALQQGEPDRALDFFLQGLRSSVSYATANFYFEIALEQKNFDAIKKLSLVVTDTTAPKGSTQAEWQQLTDRIRRSLHE